MSAPLTCVAAPLQIPLGGADGPDCYLLVFRKTTLLVCCHLPFTSSTSSAVTSMNGLAASVGRGRGSNHRRSGFVTLDARGGARVVVVGMRGAAGVPQALLAIGASRPGESLTLYHPDLLEAVGLVPHERTPEGDDTAFDPQPSPRVMVLSHHMHCNPSASRSVARARLREHRQTVWGGAAAG